MLCLKKLLNYQSRNTIFIGRPNNCAISYENYPEKKIEQIL